MAAPPTLVDAVDFVVTVVHLLSVPMYPSIDEADVKSPPSACAVALVVCLVCLVMTSDRRGLMFRGWLGLFVMGELSPPTLAWTIKVARL